MPTIKRKIKEDIHLFNYYLFKGRTRNKFGWTISKSIIASKATIVLNKLF